jgi:putative tricarboxylic transport membrane protein
MNMKKADMRAGIGICVFSTIVWAYAGRYEGRGASEYGPHLFPQFLAACLFICAVLLIVVAVRNRSIEPEDTIDVRGMYRAGIGILICVAYVVVMQLIGFTVATIAFLYSMMVFIGQKGLVTRAAVSILVAVGILLVFRYFLKIPLPEADFTFRF